MLINTKNADENKENVKETENRILDLEDRIKEMNEKENKNKNVKETLEIITKILDYNKNAQNFFHRSSKVDKSKSKPKIEESIEERVKLKNNRIAKIKKEEENINNLTFEYYFSKYKNPSDMYKKLGETKSKKNEDQVYLIKEILDEIKKDNKSAKEYIIKGNEKIINIVECVLYFNQLEQSGGLKILTPNQMLSKLPITLAQLKAGNDSEKLKKEIRQLLYSLHRSKKLTKQLYKRFIDII